YGEFANGAWDTHTYHYPRLKECLLPGLDLAFSGLIRDLDYRGMLAETLVVCMSEHRRTPKPDSKLPRAGRDQLSRGYSAGGARAASIGRGFIRQWSPGRAFRAARSSAPRTGWAATCSIPRSRPRTSWRRLIISSASTRTPQSPTSKTARTRSQGTTRKCGRS